MTQFGVSRVLLYDDQNARKKKSYSLKVNWRQEKWWSWNYVTFDRKIASKLLDYSTSRVKCNLSNPRSSAWCNVLPIMSDILILLVFQSLYTASNPATYLYPDLVQSIPFIRNSCSRPCHLYKIRQVPTRLNYLRHITKVNNLMQNQYAEAKDKDHKII
jgi:hypothetical protein